MKNQIVKARNQGKYNVVMSLTGFVTAGKEYVVKETEISGVRCVVIHEPIEKQCQNCGKDILGIMIAGNELCDECEPSY